MVKNKLGGNRAKRCGRKFISDSGTSAKTRFAEPGESYAVVCKLLGGGLLETLCIDGKTRLCVIRKKFKGRSKRDNAVKNGTWILVGKREWEVTSSGKEKCDLLEVYNQTDMDKLSSIERDYNWMPFNKITEANATEDVIEDDNGVMFDRNIYTDESDDEHGNVVLEGGSGADVGVDEVGASARRVGDLDNIIGNAIDDDDEINIDDI